MDLSKSVAEIRKLSSSEFTGWIAYYQVTDWMRKAETDDPQKAVAFAKATNDIFEERLEKKMRG